MILIVRSRFTEDITSALLQGARSVFDAENVSYKVIEVPGAVELPVAVQLGIRKHLPDAVLTIGCVIKGETDHYEYVMQSVTDGLTRVALDAVVPVVQGVLPVKVRKSAQARTHHGVDWARTAIEMAQLKNDLS